MSKQAKITNFQDFWPYYVSAHSRALTRLLHLTATLSTWVLVAGAWTTHRWTLLLLIPVVAYGISWFSHFFIEHNRPATFGHPFYSLAADYKMAGLMLIGRMDTPPIITPEKMR